MTRRAIRGPALIALMTAVTVSVGRAQNTPDTVTVRDRKDNATKAHSGTYTVSAAGFQVIGGDKKVVATVNPDDVVKVAIGDLQGVDRSIILGLIAKEDKKAWDEVRAGYKDALAKAPGAPERTRRYLAFKETMSYHKMVDDLDADKGWKEKAEDVVKAWSVFLTDHKYGWEVWPAVRASTRVQIELGKFDDAARTWGKITGNKEMPPDARLEGQLQEIDLQIRGKLYPNAALTAAELQKSATGARKERLVIYEIAAKTGGEPKQALDAVNQIKAEMDKTKDPTVHATGFAMTGELYLAAGKPRDAMWSFLWVETVLNQDRDEAFKAVARLAILFEKDLADEDQARKYRDKLKRVRGLF